MPNRPSRAAGRKALNKLRESSEPESPGIDPQENGAVEALPNKDQATKEVPSRGLRRSKKRTANEIQEEGEDGYQVNLDSDRSGESGSIAAVEDDDEDMSPVPPNRRGARSTNKRRRVVSSSRNAETSTPKGDTKVSPVGKTNEEPVAAKVIKKSFKDFRVQIDHDELELRRSKTNPFRSGVLRVAGENMVTGDAIYGMSERGKPGRPLPGVNPIYILPEHRENANLQPQVMTDEEARKMVSEADPSAEQVAAPDSTKISETNLEGDTLLEEPATHTCSVCQKRKVDVTIIRTITCHDCQSKPDDAMEEVVELANPVNEEPVAQRPPQPPQPPQPLWRRLLWFI
ncbi:hypothetical protein ABW19_dt0202827 [Dactylella cylindrospora]|nr:hypothetical protein ABW19_dt0202827 [Dactylella cylindrospora]